MSRLKAWGIRTAFIFMVLASFVVDVRSQQENTHDNSLDERALETVNSSASSGNTSQIITIPLTLPSGATPLEMVLIQPGTFTMGSPANEIGHNSIAGYGNEAPRHQVTLTNPFYIGKFLVTQAHWFAVMGTKPSSWSGNNLPVEQITWNDCQEFIKKINALGQGTFRLPTEAEWEYACRAGTTTRFYWGDDPNDSDIKSFAWYRDNASDKTHEVGLKKSNDWGLFDMNGNVWEWCQDWYGEYASDEQINPQGPATGTDRVLRGGSWYNDAAGSRSATRNKFYVDYKNWANGFRVVMTVPTPTKDNINTPENFPDNNFRTFIEGYMGVGKNGAFSMNDAAKMTKAMDCSNQDIKSLQGIEYFTGLTNLCFNNNPISSAGRLHEIIPFFQPKELWSNTHYPNPLLAVLY